MDPLRNFWISNSRHPLIDKLIQAIVNKDAKCTDWWFYQIGSYNWRVLLKSASRSNTTVVYSFLSKAEGRGRRGTEPLDLPSVLLEGQLLTRNSDKGGAIVMAFHSKLPLLFFGSVSTAVPSLFSKKVVSQYSPVLEIEAQKVEPPYLAISLRFSVRNFRPRCLF